MYLHHPKRLKNWYKNVITYVYPSQQSSDRRHRDLTDFGLRLPQRAEVLGLDVSHYQGEIDWKALSEMRVVKNRLRFVFIKATEGDYLKDAQFERNWTEALNFRLKRGAYHYFKPHIDAKIQAHHFIQHLKIAKGDLPPVLDIEESGNLSHKALIKSIKVWLQIVEQHYGIKPIIYSNLNFYKKHLRKDFSLYPCWLAQYYTSRLKYADNQWLFWQMSDKATINGIEGWADFNVFNGDSADLEKICLSPK
jgi:lysozyme